MSSDGETVKMELYSSMLMERRIKMKCRVARQLDQPHTTRKIRWETETVESERDGDQIFKKSKLQFFQFMNSFKYVFQNTIIYYKTKNNY